MASPTPRTDAAEWAILKRMQVPDAKVVGKLEKQVKVMVNNLRPNRSLSPRLQPIIVGAEDVAWLLAPTEFEEVSWPDLDGTHWIEKLCRGAVADQGPLAWVHLAKDEAGSGGAEIRMIGNLRSLFEGMLETGLCSPQAFECRWRVYDTMEGSYYDGGIVPTAGTGAGDGAYVHSIEVEGAGEAATPSAFLQPLLLHQRQSLAWMLYRERAEELFVCERRQNEAFRFHRNDLVLQARLDQAFDIRGGLLCDPIGSGKTASILALICAARNCLTPDGEAAEGPASRTLPSTTLVLCPANVHHHWIAEAAKFCGDALRVLPICASSELAATSTKALAAADVVVAPYELLTEAGYRDLASPLTEQALTTPRAPSKPKPERRPTAPGSARSVRSPSLRGVALRGNALENYNWHRLVLDEFHELCQKKSSSERSTRMSGLCASVRAIPAERRWGLSGTPGAFTSSAGIIVQAARLFRCELSLGSASEFVEHFCRRARVHVEVEVEEHVCPVDQTSAERALYLQLLRDHGIPQVLDWSQIAAFGPLIRDLMRCCSHFLAPSQDTRMGTATATVACDKSLSEKRSIAEMAQTAYFEVLLRVLRRVRRRGLLQDLFESLVHKRALLTAHDQYARLCEATAAKVAATGKILTCSELLKGIAGPSRALPEMPVRPFEVPLIRLEVPPEVPFKMPLGMPCQPRCKRCQQFPDPPPHGPLSPSSRTRPVESAAEQLQASIDVCTSARVMLEMPAGTDVPRWELTPELHDFVTALGELGDELGAAKVACENVLQSFRFFKKILSALKGNVEAETCPICLETLELTSLYLTQCGHQLCETCVPKLFARNAKCPVCRCHLKRLRDGGAFRLLPEGTEESDDKGTPHQLVSSAKAPGAGSIANEKSGGARKSRRGRDGACRERWGSKLRAVVEVLEGIRAREPFAKAIVFVQWEDLRLQLANALNEADVDHLLLKGNIFERSRALKKFQEDPEVHLLLLSLEDSASGTNLTAASHVLLLHPLLVSTLADARAAEIQAIGRVKRLGQARRVHIWRFFIRSSVEECLWNVLNSPDTRIEDGVQERSDT